MTRRPKSKQRRSKKTMKKTTTTNPFKAEDELTDEAGVFSAQLQDAVHRVVAEAGYHDVEHRRQNAPLVVHGLGVTAAAFAIVAECTQEQFLEAMRTYYQQIRAELDAIAAAPAAAAPPEAKRSLIILPDGKDSN